MITVQLGSRGEAVSGVQEEWAFRDLSGNPGAVQIDGIFGPNPARSWSGSSRRCTLTIPRWRSTASSGPVTWRALVSGLLAG